MQALFGSIVGHNHVFEAGDASLRYCHDTNNIERTILGAIRPHTVEEIQAIVVAANEHKVKLYPISTGNNWGYGSAIPTSDDSVIVDLSQMNSIISFDKHLGTVTLEPGVTQQILYEFLVEHNLPFLVPLTGAGPKASIVGNALERGFGITPFVDHAGSITAVSAVLPDGTYYTSAMREAGCDHIDDLYRYGVGPYLDGLFTQGNFGIVTSITITLARKPKKTEIFFLSASDDHELASLINEFPSLLTKTHGVVANLKVLHKNQIIAIGAKRRETDDVGLQAFPEWTVVGGVFGEPQMVEAAKEIMNDHLKRHIKKNILFLDAKKYSSYHQVLHYVPLYPRIKHAAEILASTADLLLGRPNNFTLALAYLGSGKATRKQEDLNPAKDGAGIMWFSPLVPIDGKLVTTYQALVTKILLKHGMPPLVSFTTLNERCFDAPIPIIFNKTNQASYESAKACYGELWNESQKLGLIPYRIPVDEQYRLTKQKTPFWNTVTKIKKALDKNNIIAPGRYSR